MPTKSYTTRKSFTGWKRNEFVPLLDWLNACPPWKCRAAAVRLNPKSQKLERISVDEIVRVSSISRRSLSTLSYRSDWTGVSIDVASRFAFACGVNLLARDPLRKFTERRFRKGLPYFHKKQRDALDNAAKGMK